MGYDKDKLFEEAKEIIVDKKLFFVEDVCDYMGISKPTFYKYFEVGSDEFNAIKELIRKNTIEVKVSMRNKWYKSENATLQMGLMKLICTDEERKRLSQSHHDHTSNGKEITEFPDLSKYTYEELKALAGGDSESSED